MEKRNSTVVAAYSLDGNLLKTYVSATTASKSLKVYKRTIDRAIRGEIKTVHHLLWRRYPINEVPKKIEPPVKENTSLSIRPIAKIDEKGNIINTYPSINQAVKENNIDIKTIKKYLQKEGNKSYRYLNDIEINRYGYKLGKIFNNQRKRVIQYDKDGNFIKSYPSIRKASLSINKPIQGIRDCLNGKYSSAYGYMWKYKDLPNVKRKKKVILQIQDNKTINSYHSTKEASLSTGISVSSINNCIRGRQKTAGKYIWKRTTK